MVWYFIWNKLVHTTPNIYDNPMFFETSESLIDVLTIVSRCFSNICWNISPFAKLLYNGLVSIVEWNIGH